MRDPKIMFVRQFLAALFHNQVTTIPINNDDFKQGIQNIEDGKAVSLTIEEENALCMNFYLARKK